MPRSSLGNCRISDLEAECQYCGAQLAPDMARYGMCYPCIQEMEMYRTMEDDYRKEQQRAEQESKFRRWW